MARIPSEGNIIGFIGTSLIQQNDAATASKIAHQSRGWLSWARFFSKGRFFSPIWHDTTAYPGWEPSGTPGASRNFQGLNAGVSGQFVSGIEPRKEYLGNNVKCNIVVVDAGTNDMGPTPKEEIHAARLRIAQYYLDRGIKVVLLPVLARAVNSWSATGVERKKAAWINQKTREFVQKTPNVYLWDWNAAWVDIASQNGEPRAGYSLDGIHFSTPAGVAVGESFAKFLESILPAPAPRVWSPDDVYDATHNPLGNLFPNPFNRGTTGGVTTGVTGSVSTSLRVERTGAGTATAVASKEVPTDNSGEWQVITVTPSTTDTVFLFRTNTADTPSPYTAGTWIQASVEVDIGEFDGWQYVTLYLKDNSNGGLIAYGLESFTDGGVAIKLPVRSMNGVITTPPIQILGDASTIRWRLEIGVAGNATGTGVLKARKMELRAIESPKETVGFIPLT